MYIRRETTISAWSALCFNHGILKKKVKSRHLVVREIWPHSVIWLCPLSPSSSKQVCRYTLSYLTNKFDDFQVVEIGQIPWGLCKHKIASKNSDSCPKSLVDSLLACNKTCRCELDGIRHYLKTVSMNHPSHLKLSHEWFECLQPAFVELPMNLETSKGTNMPLKAFPWLSLDIEEEMHFWSNSVHLLHWNSVTATRKKRKKLPRLVSLSSRTSSWIRLAVWIISVTSASRRCCGCKFLNQPRKGRHLLNNG